MVESTQPTYDVSFEMKKHFNPQEITGKANTNKAAYRTAARFQAV
jgi:hypothetical protein